MLAEIGDAFKTGLDHEAKSVLINALKCTVLPAASFTGNAPVAMPNDAP
jgi:hypothetical protein